MITSILLVIITGLLWTNRRYIVDSIRFWQYQPSAAVIGVTDKVDFTDNGKFLFYASQPTIDDSKSFNAECDRKEQSTAVLGCYVADRIHIYDVTDTRLEGIKEVTAAHEMLHAAYARLSPGEKARIDGLIEKEYEKMKDNAEFAERMAFYERTEPGERDNELHSIIGTEVASISQELEQYYKKYFSNRAKLVDYYNAYHKVFTSLDAERKNLSKRLDTLNAQIKAATNQYNADATTVKADIAAFNDRANSGDFTSQAQFNKERAALVSRTEQLSARRASIIAMLDEYDRLRIEYNNIVTESNELYKSIDSNLKDAPKV